MSAMSDYLEVQLRMHMFRTGSYTKPTVLGVGLATSATSDANTGATVPEVANSNAYARVARNPLDANWSAPDNTGGLTDNVADIVFPTATGSWGTVSHVFICDSATWGAGNMLYHGALAASKSVAINDIVQFPAGALDITHA